MDWIGSQFQSTPKNHSYMFGSGKKGHAYEIVMIERVL
jgi:hypothetical protein